MITLIIHTSRFNATQDVRGSAMEIDLRGKVAIVTGVGRGIGREIVSTLAREGVTTVSVDVSASDLEATGGLLDELGAPHREFACDIRDSARVAEVVAAV